MIRQDKIFQIVTVDSLWISGDIKLCLMKGIWRIPGSLLEMQIMGFHPWPTASGFFPPLLKTVLKVISFIWVLLAHSITLVLRIQYSEFSSLYTVLHWQSWLPSVPIQCYCDITDVFLTSAFHPCDVLILQQEACTSQLLSHVLPVPPPPPLRQPQISSLCVRLTNIV